MLLAETWRRALLSPPPSSAASSFVRHASSAKTTTSTTAHGRSLERRVERLLRRDGFAHVRRNVVVRDAHDNRSEIDVVARRRWPWSSSLYVECKHYAPAHAVSLDDVAKFVAVLELNGVALHRGVFVTTGRLSPRASTLGVRTVDGAQLRSWERAVSRRRVVRLLTRVVVALTLTVALVADAELLAAVGVVDTTAVTSLVPHAALRACQRVAACTTALVDAAVAHAPPPFVDVVVSSRRALIDWLRAR